MTFDPVHDSQAVFRALLDCFSRPATLRDISRLAARVDLETTIDRAILALSLTLMDPASTFAWIGPGSSVAEHFISGLTDARPVPPSKADFIVAAGGDESIEEAFSLARVGDLLNPHLGATVIALVESLDASGGLCARGLGIRESACFSVGGNPWGWIESRSARNKEFPMGVDAIFVDPRGTIMALPRTTFAGRG